MNLKQSDVLNEAYKLMKDIEDNKALKGHSLDTKVACVIVFASRQCNKEKKIEDILNYVRSDKRDISHCYKKLKNTFPALNPIRVLPSNIVSTACNKLKYPIGITNAAKLTAENFGRLAICEGKKPQTIAGTAMFMVMLLQKGRELSENDLLDEISEVVEIGKPTIRDCYNQAYQFRDQLLPEYMREKRPHHARSMQ